MTKSVKSTCGLCQAGCGVLITVKGNKVSGIAGDPESPVNRGALCEKGLASIDSLYSQDRLRYPLKRIGNRGSGQWKQITWDEALEKVADQFTRISGEYGPEALVFMRGSFKGGFQGTYLARFANLLGSPNIASMASVCYVPRVHGSMFTHGYSPVPDYDYPPECIVVWGSNLAETRIGEHHQTKEAIHRGSKLIVIDPRRTQLAGNANLWIQPRPGSDLALALGLLNVIIFQELYDENFVGNWTEGFDQLKQHVMDYPPEVVEKITWVKANRIREFAELYASSSPAVIQLGNAIDHNGNNFQTARAVSILRAITGNLGIPGGEVRCSPPGILSPMGSPELDLRDELSEAQREKRLNAADHMLPINFYTLPQTITEAILENQPYAIRGGFIQGGNILLSYTNAQRTYEALKKLDFLAVADLFMTPTAALADIILPVTSFFEFDSISFPPYYPVAQIQQKVADIHNCRSDYDILRDISRILGWGEFFWDTEEECMNEVLKPVGLTFEEFRKIGVLTGKKTYRQHEKGGFNTPSGKVELFSSRLAEWGFDPLPNYVEPEETSHSAPELAEAYPYVLTSWKTGPFRHSSGRQIPALREIQSDPLVWIHPDTANQHDIAQDDWVLIETERGKIRQKATITEDICPWVVGVDYAWWFPERTSDSLYGWAESNINILTDDPVPRGREMGTPNLRGFLCKISKEYRILENGSNHRRDL